MGIFIIILLIAFVVVAALVMAKPQSSSSSLTPKQPPVKKPSTHKPVSEEKSKISNLLLDTRSATVIHFGDFSIEPIAVKRIKESHDWDKYWAVYNRAFNYLKMKWFIRAKKEFLKLHDYEHSAETYEIQLLQTYRNIVDNLMSRKKYPQAFQEMKEMFHYCNNTTSSDKQTFKDLCKLLSDRYPGSLPSLYNPMDILTFKSSFSSIDLIASYTKQTDSLRSIKLRGLLSYLYAHPLCPGFIPGFGFDQNGFSYNIPPSSEKSVPDILKLSISTDFHTLVVLSTDKSLTVLNDHVVITNSRDISDIFKPMPPIQDIHLCSSTTHVVLAIQHKVYIFDIELTLLNTFEIPKLNFIDHRKQIREYLQIFELQPQATEREIKIAFRKHFKSNYSFKDRTDPVHKARLRRLVRIYRVLTKQPPETAFAGTESEEVWRDILHDLSMDSDDITLDDAGNAYETEINDPVEVISFSLHENKVCVGCRSGRIFHFSVSGEVHLIYQYFQVHDDPSEMSQPYRFIVPTAQYLNAVTDDGIYMLHQKALYQIDKQQNLVKWSERFICLIDDDLVVRLLTKDGLLIERLTFTDHIQMIALSNQHLFIETARLIYCFSLPKT